MQDRGTVLERWIAHHLAEAIAEASRTEGPAKAAVEAQAVDLVLKLWAHRRALPEPVDPLGGYRDAVDVLSRLMPEANPWAYYRQAGTYDELLREMFELLGMIVLAGVLLTQVSRVRPITEEEFKALEEEERYWHSALEHWMPFIARSTSKPDVEIEFISTDTTNAVEAGQESRRVGDLRNQDPTAEKQMEPEEANLHATIVSNLERMQTNLADLLTRWQESLPYRMEGEKSTDNERRFAATIDGSLDTFGDEEINQDKNEVETDRKQATPSDPRHSFWASLSLVELAEAQGVAPVDDLEGIAALFPSDEGPNELLDHVLRERADRRRAAESGSI